MKTALRLMLFGLIFLPACQGKLYKSFEDTENLIWQKEKTFSFSPTLEEAARCKLSIALRHISMIKYGQIAVRLQHTSPSGAEKTDEYILQIRNPKGELLGEALGDLCDTSCLIEPEISLEAGKHTFRLTQIMSDEQLPGIIEVGLILENAETPPEK